MIEKLRKSSLIYISCFEKTSNSIAQIVNKKGFKIKRNRFVVIFIEFFLIFQLYTLTGCSPFRKGNELTKFKNFQFTFEDPSNSKYFSVLFSQTDTFFLKRYSHSNIDTLYYSILPDSGRSIINIFVIKINSLAFDSLKFHPLEDFNSDKVKAFLYFDYPNGYTDINIHSLHPPIAFKKFDNWVNKIIENSQFNFADTSINFKEDKNIHEAMNKR